MSTKEAMFDAGWALLRQFCLVNGFEAPRVVTLTPADRYYHLNTCAFYRFDSIEPGRGGDRVRVGPTIWIMIDKCAARGEVGRQWSWPGYVVDRTPYGVLQHELGHHIDHITSDKSKATFQEGLYSYAVYQHSQEPPITSYLGTDKQVATFYKEWFAEIFRLFVTNPDLCRLLRPRFYEFVKARYQPVCDFIDWRAVLDGAPARTIAAAEKKIADCRPAPAKLF